MPTKSLRAVAHPARWRILSLLTGAEMSAAEMARELNLTCANASYHVRVLASAGRVELRDTTTPQTNCDAEVWVDPQAWGQVCSMVAEAALILHGSARPPRSEGTVHVNMTTALFTMTDQKKTPGETPR